jgi:thymidylate kinase
MDDGLEQELLLNIHERLPVAAVNIFIDVPIEEATRRRPEAQDRYERDKEKLKRVRERYLWLWAHMNDRNIHWPTPQAPAWIVIDGVGTPRQVFDRILACYPWQKAARFHEDVISRD